MFPSWKKLFAWLFCVCLAVLVLSLGFAYAPGGLRRVGISYVFFGFFCGGAIGWLAREMDVRRRISASILGGLIVVVGAGNIGWQSFLIFRQVKQAELEKKPQEAAMIRRMFEENANRGADGAMTTEDLITLRRIVKPTYADFLAFRQSANYSLAAPWPAIIWGVEILLASATASWIAYSFAEPKSADVSAAPQADVEDDL